MIMKKILINYIGKSGGGPAFALEFAKGLALNGCEVYAVMSEFVDNRKSWDCCELIKDVYYVKTNEFRGKKYYAKAQLEFILTGKRKLKHYFKDIEFDYEDQIMIDGFPYIRTSRQYSEVEDYYAKTFTDKSLDWILSTKFADINGGLYCHSGFGQSSLSREVGRKHLPR